MISTTFYLSNFGFTFDTGHIARQEVEYHIQSRFHGIHPAGQDYLFQPRYPSDIWQVNGTSDLGAKACASVCRGLSFQPNRIDITCQINDSGFNFFTAAIAIEDWFKRNKQKTEIETFKNAYGFERWTFGTRKSRFSLRLEEMENFSFRVTWNMRQDKVMPTWEWLDFFHDGTNYNDICREAFTAVTNSIIGSDLFGLGLSEIPKLTQTKRADVPEDWWGFLSGVASKIKAQARKEKSDYLAVESVKFIEEQISKMVQKDAKEINEALLLKSKSMLS